MGTDLGTTYDLDDLDCVFDIWAYSIITYYRTDLASSKTNEIVHFTADRRYAPISPDRNDPDDLECVFDIWALLNYVLPYGFRLIENQRDRRDLPATVVLTKTL